MANHNRPTVYAIRTSLHKSRFQSQIQVGRHTLLPSLSKPMTIASLFSGLFSFVFLAMLFTYTPVRFASWSAKIIFVIGYYGLYYCLFTRTETLSYKRSLIKPAIAHVIPGNRYIETGWLANGASLIDLLDVDAKKGVNDNGQINFTNNEVGLVFEVVGNASSMLFQQDQNNVVNDTRTFYRTLPAGVNVSIFTQSSIQDVTEQISSKREQLAALQIDSPGLRQVIKQQAQVLDQVVGEHFSMIRQYMVVRGKPEQVKSVVANLRMLVSKQNNNYLKSAKLLNNIPRKGQNFGEVDVFLHSIYDDNKPLKNN